MVYANDATLSPRLALLLFVFVLRMSLSNIACILSPIGVLIWVIISYSSQHLDLVKIQGAVSNVTCPFLRSIGHALRIFPQHCDSIHIANESRMSIKWSHNVVATFLKKCIGSSKWLIVMSSQQGKSKNMDSLQILHIEISAFRSSKVATKL
jgi:hypothetical protein